ncbi:hypothetical protein ACFRCI_19720 [Streptomyces sp. NPDC056638]|uniref:hypothetical protein n=1 Tax=Streptomyces sp. NPDC056638 TaxID=3345887 RepID=UPI00368B4C40
MCNGALSDMGLGFDPCTGNRYAFTGGHPVNFIETDGHCFGCDVCEDVFDDATDLAVGGAKKSKSGWLSVVDVFLDGTGWNTPTAPNGYESEPGGKLDYGKGCSPSLATRRSGRAPTPDSRSRSRTALAARACCTTCRSTTQGVFREGSLP